MAQGRGGSLHLARTALSSAPLFPFTGAFQDTTPATLPTARRLSTFGCLTTQPWHNPEGPCRDGSSRLARLHTFYPARDSGPEPVNVYGTGKVLGHNRGSRREYPCPPQVYIRRGCDSFAVVGFPPPAKAG